ncbi:hypothetical protein RQP46_004503 [Phenoliferia psychrophenolica]
MAPFEGYSIAYCWPEKEERDHDEEEEEEDMEDMDEDDDATDIDPESEWLRRPVFVAYDDKGDEVATIKLWVMDFWQLRSSFYGEMDGPSDECMQFGFTLFDERGYTRKRFAKEGNACWGKEISGKDKDLTPVFYVEEIKVKPAHRGKGLGSWIVNEFLTSDEIANHLWTDRPPEFLFAWPTILKGEHEDDHINWYDEMRNPPPAAVREAREQVFVERRDKVINFFRKSGFRRVGDTAFFCIARDAKHPSRKISAAQDALVKQVSVDNPAAAEVAEGERNDAVKKMMTQWGVPGYP